MVWACLPFVWLIVHALCVDYWAARTCLWISDVHPLLGSPGAAVLTVLVTVREGVEGDSRGVPYSLWLVLNLFGLATSLILAHAEYHQRRTHHRCETSCQNGAGSAMGSTSVS